MPIKAPTEDGTAIKTVTKKLYYLACAFCRWTSRDAGLPDQVSVPDIFDFKKYNRKI